MPLLDRIEERMSPSVKRYAIFVLGEVVMLYGPAKLPPGLCHGLRLGLVALYRPVHVFEESFRQGLFWSNIGHLPQVPPNDQAGNGSNQGSHTG